VSIRHVAREIIAARRGLDNTLRGRTHLVEQMVRMRRRTDKGVALSIISIELFFKVSDLIFFIGNLLFDDKVRFETDGACFGAGLGT
jgi:hypothetical protein